MRVTWVRSTKLGPSNIIPNIYDSLVYMLFILYSFLFLYLYIDVPWDVVRIRLTPKITRAVLWPIADFTNAIRRRMSKQSGVKRAQNFRKDQAILEKQRFKENRVGWKNWADVRAGSGSGELKGPWRIKRMETHRRTGRTQRMNKWAWLIYFKKDKI